MLFGGEHNARIAGDPIRIERKILLTTKFLQGL